ncbi:MAG: glycosyltransferase [Gallionella sp.]
MDDFWNKSALGLSLKRISHETRFQIFVAYENRRGLPEIFNSRIAAQNDHDILAFVHDDIWIEDYFLADRIVEGLEAFDVIGVAGNRRRVRDQPAWACKPMSNGELAWDDMANLSGSIAHGPEPFGHVSFFGPTPAECELLDGVFLAARKSTLTTNRVLFDPIFDFHFYDMDFCRSIRKKGLRLGTWPICLTHQSGGGYDNQNWLDKLSLYREKWEK